jgi:2-desacetyl-2-hydroxyethyl bacteriochlorophyllide A dehydrogenase
VKAVIWNGPNSQLSLEDIPVPRAGFGEVVIKVKASGLCGSDLSIAKGRMPLKNWPLVLGHQTGGIVHEVGEGVKSFKSGDRVVCTPDIPCGVCRYCRIGRTNLCRSLKRIGFEINGSDAEYVLTSERSVIQLPGSIDFEQGSIAVDAVASMYHALFVQAQARPGNKIILLGIGGMGIQAIEMSHLCGATVLVTSRSDKRLDFAKKLGADVLVNTTKQDISTEAAKFTLGEGADIVIDSIGGSGTMKQAIELLRPGGKIMVIGLMEPEFSLPFMKMVMLEAEVIGSRTATKQDVIETLNLIAEKKLHPVVTNRYPLSDFRAGFEALEKGEIFGRGVLIP